MENFTSLFLVGHVVTEIISDNEKISLKVGTTLEYLEAPIMS